MQVQRLDFGLDLGPGFDLGIMNSVATGPSMGGLFSKAYSLVLEKPSITNHGEIRLSYDAAQLMKPPIPDCKFSCAVWNVVVLDGGEQAFIRACSTFYMADGPSDSMFFLIRRTPFGNLELLVSTQHLHPDKMSAKFAYEAMDFAAAFATASDKANELRIRNGMYWTEADALEAKTRAMQFEFPGWEYQKDGRISRTMGMEDADGDYFSNRYKIDGYGSIELQAGDSEGLIHLGSCSSRKQAFLAVQCLERMLDDMNWESSVPEDAVAPFSPTREQDLQAIRAGESHNQQTAEKPATIKEESSNPAEVAVPEHQRPHLYVYPPEYVGDQERHVLISDPVSIIYLPDGSRAVTSGDGTKTLVPAGFHRMQCGFLVDVNEAPASTLYL